MGKLSHSTINTITTWKYFTKFRLILSILIFNILIKIECQSTIQSIVVEDNLFKDYIFKYCNFIIGQYYIFNATIFLYYTYVIFYSMLSKIQVNISSK